MENIFPTARHFILLCTSNITLVYIKPKSPKHGQIPRTLLLALFCVFLASGAAFVQWTPRFSLPSGEPAVSAFNSLTLGVSSSCCAAAISGLAMVVATALATSASPLKIMCHKVGSLSGIWIRSLWSTESVGPSTQLRDRPISSSVPRLQPFGHLVSYNAEGWAATECNAVTC